MIRDIVKRRIDSGLNGGYPHRILIPKIEKQTGKHVVNLRFTTEEIKIINAFSESCGLSRSDFMYRKIFDLPLTAAEAVKNNKLLKRTSTNANDV